MTKPRIFLLGLTSVRYDPDAGPAEVRAINQKLRKAIETEGRRGPVEGLWWQLSLTERSEDEPSAVSLLCISRDRGGSEDERAELIAQRVRSGSRPRTRSERSAGLSPGASWRISSQPLASFPLRLEQKPLQ